MGLAGADQSSENVKSPSLEAVSRRDGFDSILEGIGQTRYVPDHSHCVDIDAGIFPSPNHLLDAIGLVRGSTMASDNVEVILLS